MGGREGGRVWWNCSGWIHATSVLLASSGFLPGAGKEVSVGGKVDEKISQSHARVYARVDLQDVAGALQRQLWQVAEELRGRGVG